MEDIKQYSLQADLALAAYATLSSGNPNTASLEAIGMSTSQAIDFAKRWTVIDQYTHSETELVVVPTTGETYYATSSNGVSATVFENVETKQRYLAVRGTQPKGSASIPFLADTDIPRRPCIQLAETPRHAVQRAIDPRTVANYL